MEARYTDEIHDQQQKHQNELEKDQEKMRLKEEEWNEQIKEIKVSRCLIFICHL